MLKPEQGNKASMKGEAKKPKDSGSKSESQYVGSSTGEGIRFPIHDHPDLSKVRGPSER